MTNRSRHPSYLSCVAEILRTSPDPLTVDTMVARIKKRRPVGSGVRSAIYQAIGKLYQAIPVAPGCYGWLSLLLKGQWFRHPLNGAEIRKGYLLLDELEHAVFFPEFFQSHQPDNRSVRLQLMGGPTLEARAVIEQGTWSLRMGSAFSEWVDLMGGTAYDDLLIWVKDAVAGEYGVRLQPREARQEEEIQARNQLLVEAAEEIVTNDRKARTAVPVWELAAALIGRGIYGHPVPPDDMHYVLHENSRLQLLDDMGYAFGAPSTVKRGWNRYDASNRTDRSERGREELPPRHSGDTGGEVWEESFLREFLANDFDETDGPELEEAIWNFFDDEDSASEYCEGYQAYLVEYDSEPREEDPLSHMDFHLLEAELEMLVSLEQEFGYLMPEQEERKFDLAERLFIDLDFFFDEGDWDQSDFEDPPFWEN